MKRKVLGVGALVAMLLTVFVLVLLLGGGQPAPALAEVGDQYFVELFDGSTEYTAATVYEHTCEAGAFNMMDVYYSATISGTDTISLVLQSSPDGASSTWVDQATLINASSTDVSASVERLSVYGRCVRLKLTQSDATAVTPVTPLARILFKTDAGGGGADIAVVDDLTVGDALSVVGATTLGDDVTVGSSKFTVAAATGNTVVAGTLGVTGATTLTGAAALNGGLTMDSTAFVVANTTGDTSIGGTLGVTGATTLAGALAANGGLSVDSSAFSVEDATGNTVVSGTLTVSDTANLNGGLAMDTDKFAVANTTGNTTIAGTLKVAGAANLVLDATAITTDTVLTAADSGTYIAFKNQDTFSVQVDLPAAAAGLNVCFFNYDGDDVVINPDDADQIVVLTNAAGDSLTNTTAGDAICLVALDATDWMAVPGVTGTWSDGN